ncbi:DNA excision repair protein [Raphidocelis subcapitata]|uniref:DNA excision repair protein n=1 Tax=Raphidocelis subcapitata TaxID=307507 RepID=A0A2V0PLD2_9CHLO|nr:DNA excision repair protein [Raphidocelis subcapitata]|eukprot:GBF97835.1 DNA excision repair protein [Raphidocelis subcapitata]
MLHARGCPAGAVRGNALPSHGLCPARASVSQRRSVRAASEPPQRGVRGLEDFVLGGPKLRKWYGQEDGPARPRDGGGAADEPQQQEAGGGGGGDAGPRDVVLVTDGESTMGEMVVLQLILARAKVRMVANDVTAAKAGYGPYVEPVSPDVGGGGGLARALRGVRCVVALGRLGKLLPAAKEAGVEHIVLLSTAGMPQPGGLAALFGGGAGDAALREPAREQAVAASGLPYIIVKAGPFSEAPGGASALAFSAAAAGGGGGGGGGGVSREDVACVVARLVLDVPLPAGAAATVVVSSAGPGAPPADWTAALQPLVAA